MTDITQYQHSIDAFLLEVGKPLVRSIHEGEMQKAGLERLASYAGLGFFTKSRSFAPSEMYALFHKLAPQKELAQASALASAIPEGKSYEANFSGSRIQISRTNNQYTVSR